MSSAIAQTRERVPSDLIQVVLKQAKQRPRLEILDLDSGVGVTLETLSQQKRCRFYFADIGQHTGTGYGGVSRRILPFNLPHGLKFDLCLFWDCLNLMNDAVFKQFAGELEEYLDRDTLIHGFIANNVRVPMFYKRFAIEKSDTLVSLDPVDYTSRYPKSRKSFEEAFPQIELVNVVRYPSNRQEILARHR